MAEFKIVVSDPRSGKAHQIVVKGEKASPFIGKRIGDKFDGSIIGLPTYEIQITGGVDRDGFPMHPAVEGIGRKRVLLSSLPCFRPKEKGERRRKTVRGNMISEDIVQINCKIIKWGEKDIEELLKA